MSNRSNKRLGNIEVLNAMIGYRNFAGAQGQYNKLGDKNFCIFLEKDTALILQEDGWNIKWTKPKIDDQEDPKPFLPVAVGFGKYPPELVMITSKGKTQLDEDTVALVDWPTVITNVDVIVRPYTWEGNGKSGIKAYVKEMYVTVEDMGNSNSLAQKYEDIPLDPDAAYNNAR